MPCLSSSFDPAVGPIINIGVRGPDQSSARPGEQLQAFPALIDTGASITCISNAVIQAIGLLPIGMREMVSATHQSPVNVYLVDLIIPFGATAHIRQGMQVMEFNQVGHSPFQILLGRDIICIGVFNISFDGHYTFSL